MKPDEFTKDFHDGNQCSGVSTLELNKDEDELTEAQQEAWMEFEYQMQMINREDNY